MIEAIALYKCKTGSGLILLIRSMGTSAFCTEYRMKISEEIYPM
jgi:hypothetical protein